MLTQILYYKHKNSTVDSVVDTDLPEIYWDEKHEKTPLKTGMHSSYIISQFLPSAGIFKLLSPLRS